jgi:choice-of-anchor A domain-containing protein
MHCFRSSLRLVLPNLLLLAGTSQVLADDYPYTVAAGSAFGVAQSFNALVFQDFTANYSDVEGKLAAGGNITVSGYSVGALLESGLTGPSVLAAGSISYQNGAVYGGDMVAGADTSNVTDSVISGLGSGYGLYSYVSPLPVDFAAIETELTATSQALAALTANAEVISQWGGLYMTANCTDSLQVFAVDGETLLASHTFSVDTSCAPADATYVFNISGTDTGLTNMGMQSLSALADHVVYNFYEATALTLAGVSVEGSILAPAADIENPQGVIRGHLFARSWNGGMQINHVPFKGDLSVLKTGLGNAGEGIDEDEDGISDDLDQCLGTDAGASVDANGCADNQLDDDLDGVTNDIDQCSATAAGDVVDSTGCTVIADADADGIADDVDQCANTAAGFAVNANGCADNQLDDDLDGVTNDIDQCANTPAGDVIDANGCTQVVDTTGGDTTGGNTGGSKPCDDDKKQSSDKHTGGKKDKSEPCDDDRKQSSNKHTGGKKDKSEPCDDDKHTGGKKDKSEPCGDDKHTGGKKDKSEPCDDDKHTDGKKNKSEPCDDDKHTGGKKDKSEPCDDDKHTGGKKDKSEPCDDDKHTGGKKDKSEPCDDDKHTGGKKDKSEPCGDDRKQSSDKKTSDKNSQTTGAKSGKKC